MDTPPTPRGEAIHRALQKLDQTLDRMISLNSEATQLHKDAQSAPLTVEREGAIISLKSTIEMLEGEIKEVRKVLSDVMITDIAGLFIVAGRSRDEALREAIADFDGIVGVVTNVEDRVKEMKADVVYGFDDGGFNAR